mgnify:CR=1 FL=1
MAQVEYGCGISKSVAYKMREAYWNLVFQNSIFFKGGNSQYCKDANFKAKKEEERGKNVGNLESKLDL